MRRSVTTSSGARLFSRFRLDRTIGAITGAAHGIGRTTAELFAAAGAHVLLLDRDGDAAHQAAEEITREGGAATAFEVDVASEASIEQVFGEIHARFGALDVLVNNAGIAIRRPALQLELDDWNKVVSVNMTGVFLCSRVATRYMIAAGKSGAIVNTASVMGLSGGGVYPNISYQTTKGAIVNMTRALAVEWAAQGIRVNAVAPTYVATALVAGLMEEPGVKAAIESMTPMRRLAQPGEVATAILFLASPAASMVTGHILAVDGGFLAQ